MCKQAVYSADEKVVFPSCLSPNIWLAAHHHYNIIPRHPNFQLLSKDLVL